MSRKQSNILPASEIAAQIINFAATMVKHRRTDGKPDPIPPGWIVRKLIERGRLAWWGASDQTEGIYIVVGQGPRSRYGLSNLYTLTTDASDPPTFAVGDAAILQANPQGRPMRATIERYATMINRLDIAILANSKSALRTQMIGVPKRQKEAVELALEDMNNGDPTLLTQELVSEMADLPMVDLSVPFQATDFHNLRAELMREALRQWGGVAPVQYKAERVQSAEVANSNGESVDNVYVMIDSFNEWARRGGVPYELYYDGVGADIDREPQESATTGDYTEEVQQ